MDKLAIHKLIGQRLRHRRRVSGTTLLALAEACGISYQQIHKYEMGATAVSAAMLWKLARALDVPVTHFYDDLPPYTGLRLQPKLARDLAGAFEAHLVARRGAPEAQESCAPIANQDHGFLRVPATRKRNSRRSNV